MSEILNILVIFLCFKSIRGQQSCSDISKYYADFYGTLYGEVNIAQVPVQQITFVEVELSVAARLPKRNDWKIAPANENVYDDIINGRGIKMKFEPLITNPLPKVTAVFLNGNQICSDPPARGSYVSTIKLQYTYTISNVPQSNQMLMNQQSMPAPNTYVQSNYMTTTYAPPAFIPDRTTHRTEMHVSNKFGTITKIEQSIVCGIRRGGKKTSSFILNGQRANKNDFPWLAAFYYRENGFICGGSLISARIVITAAHCVQDKSSIEIRSAYDSTFYLGKYNIKDLNELDYVNAGVDQFILHPDWNPQSHRYEADVCVVVLSKTIKFTNSIVPLCIWPQRSSHGDLINKSGLVAGWGITESGLISDVPEYASLPVVDDLKCLRSNGAFSTISSPTTFCVGDMSGRTPCSGDSGGAFAYENPQDQKYYLRGIVSAGIKTDDGRCSKTDYVLFTDVALYSAWITSHITTYG